MGRVVREQPLRIKATGRQVYLVWNEWDGPAKGTFWVDLREGTGGPRGFRYRDDGTPYDDGCPWGEIENWEENPFETIEHVTPADAYNPAALAAKREREHAAMVDAMGDSDAWGLF